MIKTSTANKHYILMTAIYARTLNIFGARLIYAKNSKAFEKILNFYLKLKTQAKNKKKEYNLEISNC